MTNRIHILGPPGSGTTTLGRDLAASLDAQHFDADHYYWLPTKPPFQETRALWQRQAMLLNDLNEARCWVLSGSVCGWGDSAISLFDLVVYLWLPTDLRLSRLMYREHQRYGNAIAEGGPQHRIYRSFIEWAARYDHGDFTVRSRRLHEQWLAEIPCPVLRLEDDLSPETRLARVLDSLSTKTTVSGHGPALPRQNNIMISGS